MRDMMDNKFICRLRKTNMLYHFSILIRQLICTENLDNKYNISLSFSINHNS